MSSLDRPSNADLIGLDAIAKNLGLGKRWKGPRMVPEVVKACEEEASAVLAGTRAKGEAIAAKLASHYGVKFEEVHSARDIDALEDHYLRGKKELTFGVLRQELADPGVDALLFRRNNARIDEPDQWIAVLNLLVTTDRAYWDRFHELSHRLAEPPQLLLRFRREVQGEKGAVEQLIDTITGELAFHRDYFAPLISATCSRPLDFALINWIKESFAPTASLLSVTNAVTTRWPRPAICFTARLQTKRADPNGEQCLRIQLQCTNPLARERGIVLYNNMRVPLSSIAYQAWETRSVRTGMDKCVEWSTRRGYHLPDMDALVSAIPMGNWIYCTMSL
jgi:hypothetical protein